MEPRDADAQSDNPDEPPVDDRLLDLTLRQITDRWGSQQGFIDFLDARKKIADTHARELQNQETKGQLIPRDFVKTHLIGLIDGTNRRLLTDFPRTASVTLIAMAKTGAPIEDVRRALYNQVSSHVGHVKAKALRTLKNRKDPDVDDHEGRDRRDQNVRPVQAKDHAASVRADERREVRTKQAGRDG